MANYNYKHVIKLKASTVLRFFSKTYNIITIYVPHITGRYVPVSTYNYHTT